MQKSKNITKYNIDWQILRASIKGKNQSMEGKIHTVRVFFLANKTQDNWERCVNFLEGLQLGYKAAGNLEAIHAINEELELYKVENVLELEKEENEVSSVSAMKKHGFKERYALWIDLYKRNRDWLLKGYFQKEVNTFMDNLWETFALFEEEDQIKANYQKECLLKLRQEASFITNKHKFFF